MSLRVTDSWTTSRPEMIGLCLAALSRSQFLKWLDHPSLHGWKRPAAITLSIAIHALFISALITHGLSPTKELESLKSRAENMLVLFQLSPPSKPPPINDKREEGAGSQAQRQAQENRMINPIDPKMISEWSVGRIFAQRDSALTISTLPGDAGRLGSGVGQGAGDGYGFDPYAGASPRWRDEVVAPILDYDFGISPDPMLDRDAFLALIDALRRRIGSTRGSILFAASVDPTGRVIGVEIRGGDANMQLKLFIRSQIIGERLFVAGTRGTRQLPPIRI